MSGHHAVIMRQAESHRMDKDVALKEENIPDRQERAWTILVLAQNRNLLFKNTIEMGKLSSGIMSFNYLNEELYNSCAT